MVAMNVKVPSPSKMLAMNVKRTLMLPESGTGKSPSWFLSPGSILDKIFFKKGSFLGHGRASPLGVRKYTFLVKEIYYQMKLDDNNKLYIFFCSKFQPQLGEGRF